jgi:uncharacterized protein
MATIALRPPDLVLRGRKVVGGVTEGEALVTRQTISGWGGVNPMTGTVIESRHELKGVSFAGKVLVFPGAKGSSGWSGVFHTTRLKGVAPLAMLFNVMTTKAALGSVVLRVPAMTGFDHDPLTCIATGDWVRVDADAGEVQVWQGGAG